MHGKTGMTRHPDGSSRGSSQTNCWPFQAFFGTTRSVRAFLGNKNLFKAQVQNPGKNCQKNSINMILLA